MKKFMREHLICIIFFFNFICLEIFAQSPSLEDFPVYKDLNEALSNPEIVYRLNLSKQKLEALPAQVFLLKNLRELDLSKNKIKITPQEIKQLSQLEILDLSKNQLDSFSSEICALVKLRILRISRNNLSAIPSEIENLQQLEILDLWDNNLSLFPDNLNKLTSLKKLDLRGILLDEKQQKNIQELLPQTKIYFSPSCNCGF